MAKLLTLGKNERLKSRKQIDQLFSEGKKFTITPFRIFYSYAPGINQNSTFRTKLGVGVSNKNFKKAVDRNRIKRLIREAWRLQKNSPAAILLNEKLKSENSSLHIFIIYTSKELPVLQLVKEKAELVLKKFSE